VTLSVARKGEAGSEGRVSPTAVAIARTSLSSALREATRALHHRAERTGVVADLLRGAATKHAYATLLRNLLPVYRVLEDQLEIHRAAPAVRLVARRELYRAESIAHDLAELGVDPESTPVLPESEDHVRRIVQAAAAEPARLIGHAYTRYLGDLSGGQVLRKLLARSFALRPSALTLYDFPGIVDLKSYKVEFRAALDRAAQEADATAMLDEAMTAFRLSIALSCAVKERIARDSPAPQAPG
jgi:heme oxygenase